MFKLTNLINDVLIETGKAFVDLVNQAVNSEDYYSEATPQDLFHERTPIQLFIGLGRPGVEYKAENITVELRPERIVITAEEIPGEVLGEKFRESITVPYGVEIISVEFDEMSSLLSIFTTLTNADETEVIQTVRVDSVSKSPEDMI